jgi:NADH dehydrogenase
VVVVGAGFGGLRAAKELRDAPVDVTIVDRHNFHTFQPLLYQVATAGLNAADIAYPVRGIFHYQDNVSFRQGNVTGADFEHRRLLLDDGHSLRFDHLVIAAGATTNDFGVAGADHAFPLYSLNDAVRLRNHILERFEAADADGTLVDDGALTVAIVGGGPTGVEVAGALSELFSMVLRKDFRRLDVGKARVLLIEMQDHLLGPFKPVSRKHAYDTLQLRGVEILLGEAVDRITPMRVHLKSGEIINCHTVIWAAGVKPSPLASILGLPTGTGGRIAVGTDLVVVGHPEVYAVGDIAAMPEAGKILPQLAPVAMQAGRHAARQIKRTVEGRRHRPFHFRNKGIMATIGRRSAVAELPGGIFLSGTPAWLAWLGLHLLYLIGFRNRLSVLLNWGWSYLTWDRGPRLILRPDEPK